MKLSHISTVNTDECTQLSTPRSLLDFSKMVAIYVPVVQSAGIFIPHIVIPYNHDYKTAFMLRALRACNEAKDNKITCLGTAVTYHRRCRNPLRMTKWAVVAAQMVAVAEDGSFTLGDLKFLAANWAAGLSCYLHGAQKGVAMAALGAVVLYRQTFPGSVVAPHFCHLPMYPRGYRPQARYANGFPSLGTENDAQKYLLAKSLDESNAVFEGWLNQTKAKHAKEKLHRFEKAFMLLSTVKAVLLVLLVHMLLLYLSILLLGVGISLPLGSQ